ncbi:MAG: malate dehydrogenase [Oxalobacteraceae bacterium]|nr:MAG: malate dehydrogenase [Oxalobacteraceae bacterium]
MATSHIRVAITGAAGQIGYALLFRVASGQMFGPNTRVSLQLLELESALPSLRGTIMELEDCAFPLLDAVTATANPDEAFEGAHWVLMVGSVPRKKGMERSELLGINGKVFTAQGKSIDKHADPSVRIFVVGNPCNTNCLIAMHNAPSIPKDRFFAMTALDENRARTQLAKKTAVSLGEVKNLVVWGNHSAKQFPDFINARIGKTSAVDAIADEQWLKQTFVPMIQQRGAAVIEARGSSSAASAANAVVDGVRRLLDETPEGTCFSVSRFSCGEYGVPKGLIFSFPCRVRNGKVEVVEGFSLTPYVQQCINGVIDELQEEYNAVKSLKLIP